MKAIKIPYDLLRENLTLTEKIVMSFLCINIRDNKKISNYANISIQQINRLLKKLEGKGYIKLRKKTYQEAFEILNIKNSEKGCLFCGYNKSTLDVHHYPIKSSEGGKDVISLCANCHREFHSLTDYNKDIIILKKYEVECE